MKDDQIEPVFDELLIWCRARDFAGHDPFDALNSRLFQHTPFQRFRIPRLIWTQLVKRSPLDLRRPLLVPSQKNSKGVALFALAALANFRRLRTSEAEQEARRLLSDLLGMRISGFSGAAWGYNFDWQSRNFFAPQGTPTIVPTAFAARALIEAFEIFREDGYLKVVRSACDFILKDLNRTFETEEELCFSYSPLDQTQIFNASLFAAETLASVGVHTGETELCELATRAARFVHQRQREDGSWSYGTGPTQGWVDSFHTAYVLLSLARISRYCEGSGLDVGPALERGYRFWRESFFLADGWPKYYHDELYPADTHAAATAIVTLLELRHLDESALAQAERIADWAIRNLRDRRGFFYYQRRRFHTVRTPFMRWSEAWMLYALARLLEAKVEG